MKELAHAESIQWKPGERERHGKPDLELEWLKRWNEIPKNAKPRTKDLDAHIVKKLVRAGDGSDFFKQVHYASTFLDAMTDAAAIAAWNEYPPRAWGLYPDDLLYVLARFDTAEIAEWLRVAEALDRWSKIFSEYEIIQPFAQLARDTYAPDGKEKEATARGPGLAAWNAPRRGLDLGHEEGPRRRRFGRAGPRRRHLRGRHARISAEQELGAITLTKVISELDAIAFSELVRDVTMLSA